MISLCEEFRLILMYSFIQQSLIQKLSEWQTENIRLTKDLCNDLLSKLKRQHLDPILHQLQRHGGSNLSFHDIIAVYHRIKDDYERQAVGAKDVIAAAFFEFQPVSISSILNVLHAAFDLVVACSGVRLALWLFLVLFYFVLYCCLFRFSFFMPSPMFICLLFGVISIKVRLEKPLVSGQMTVIFRASVQNFEHIVNCIFLFLRCGGGSG